MRVYAKLGWHSYGIGRVAIELERRAPEGFEIVEDESQADLIVIHVNGRHDHKVRQAETILESGRKYAVIQYVLGSCRNPDPQDWIWLWKNAVCVWSYYDLRAYTTNQYFSPLGVNSDVFYRENLEKRWLVGTNGNSYKAECIGEVRLAAFDRGRTVHIGPEQEPSPITDFHQDVSDDELRRLYNQCKWFSCLRRKDGFEIIALEALLCGVRPIVFDAPRFRQWFEGLAEFIPEEKPEAVMHSLRALFKKEPESVTDEQIEMVKARFDWGKIASGFYEMIRQ